MREPGPVLSMLNCKDLSFPFSHIINPPTVSCLANMQTEPLQSRGTLLPPSYSSTPPLQRAHVPAVRGETMGRNSSKDTLLISSTSYCVQISLRRLWSGKLGQTSLVLHLEGVPQCQYGLDAIKVFDSFIRHSATWNSVSKSLYAYMWIFHSTCDTYVKLFIVFSTHLFISWSFKHQKTVKMATNATDCSKPPNM